MTNKKIAQVTQSKTTLEKKEDLDKENKRLAKCGLSPIALSALTSKVFSKSALGEIEICSAIEVMRGKVDEVSNGNLKGLETTLTAQATTLDTMFNSLAIRANNSDTMPKLEIYMRLALKAQAQCARTIEVLATMKNPPVIFAKQANISNGNQQVNNGCPPNSLPTHAGKTVNQSNELLEVTHGSKTVDFRAEAATSEKDKAMATMETVNRG